MSKVIDPATLDVMRGAGFPPPKDAPFDDREKRALGAPANLTQFGVNLVRVKPGKPSALRHWHAEEDEFVYILEGTATLITEDGRQTLTAGMCAGFPAGVEDAHHMINDGDVDLVFLEIGTKKPNERCYLPDDNLRMERTDGVSAFVDASDDTA